MRKISVETMEGEMNFDDAREEAALAAAILKGLSPGDMKVIAWYDRRSRRSSPEVGFSESDVVHWERSAVNLGADTWVEMNRGRYIFLCGSSLKH